MSHSADGEIHKRIDDARHLFVAFVTLYSIDVLTFVVGEPEVVFVVCIAERRVREGLLRQWRNQRYLIVIADDSRCFFFNIKSRGKTVSVSTFPDVAIQVLYP